MNTCVFCQIAKGEMPKEFTYEDEDLMVFPDIEPVASLHLLIVPRKHIEDFVSGEMEDGRIWAKMTKIVKDLIKTNHLTGYRLVLNGGEAKLVNHLHWHLMGNVNARRKL